MHKPFYHFLGSNSTTSKNLFSRCIERGNTTGTHHLSGAIHPVYTHDHKFCLQDRLLLQSCLGGRVRLENVQKHNKKVHLPTRWSPISELGILFVADLTQSFRICLHHFNHLNESGPFWATSVHTPTLTIRAFHFDPGEAHIWARQQVTSPLHTRQRAVRAHTKPPS